MDVELAQKMKDSLDPILNRLDECVELKLTIPEGATLMATINFMLKLYEDGCLPQTINPYMVDLEKIKKKLLP